MPQDDETPRPADLGRLQSGGVSGATLTLTVEQALDEIRLAVLGIVLSVAVSVGFGTWALACWGLGVASFVATILALAVLLRSRRSRRVLVRCADWLLGR